MPGNFPPPLKTTRLQETDRRPLAVRLRLVRRPTAEPENRKMKAEKQRPLRFNPVLIGFALLILLGIAGTVLAWLEESARRESADRRAPGYRPSLVGRVNPFLPDATPTPVQLSKEYIYAGSRLLAVVSV